MKNTCKYCKKRLIFRTTIAHLKCFEKHMKEYRKKKLEMAYRIACYKNKISQWKFNALYI